MHGHKILCAIREGNERISLLPGFPQTMVHANSQAAAVNHHEMSFLQTKDWQLFAARTSQLHIVDLKIEQLSHEELFISDDNDKALFAS